MNPFSLTKPFNLQKLSLCRYSEKYRHGIGTIGTPQVPIPKAVVPVLVPILDFAFQLITYCPAIACRDAVPIVPIVPILSLYLDGCGLQVRANTY